MSVVGRRTSEQDSLARRRAVRRRQVAVAAAVVVGVTVVGVGLAVGLRAARTDDQLPRQSGDGGGHLLGRIDCYPEARWGGGGAAAVTRAACERRGCEYDPDPAVAGVPACIVSADSVLGAGFAVARVRRRRRGQRGFTVDLRSNAAADADAAIRPLDAVLDVRFLAENVLRLTVGYILGLR